MKTPLRIPRYISVINNIAEKAGITVDVAVEDGTLICNWRGTKSQLRATRLLQKRYQFPSPRATRTFGIPKGSWYLSDHLRCFFVSGEITVHGPRFELRCNYGATATQISEKQEVETAAFKDHYAIHGSADALIATKTCSPSQIPGLKTTKCSRDEGAQPQWMTRRLPDGSYLHCRETPAAAKRRHDEYKRHFPSSSRNAEQKRNLPDYASPEEWLESKEDMLIVGAQVIVRHCSVETKDGLRYSVNPAHFAAIANDIEAIAQRIRQVPVKVENLAPKSTAVARDNATAAASDGKFQSFMQSVIVPQKPRRK
jgi:hypothetical protein